MSAAQSLSPALPEAKVDNLPASVRFDEDLVRDVNKVDRPGSLAHRIMMLVAYKSYQQAVSDLNEHIKIRSQELNALYIGSHRYVLRCQTLAAAIEKKRNLPNLDMQPAAKQQEVFELIREYFKELRAQLKGIEGVERALIVDDVRSTVWVVRTVFYCLVAILVMGFMIDISTGALDTCIAVATEYFHRLSDWILGLFFKA